jgi:UDP-glucose 4-epimerase
MTMNKKIVLVLGGSGFLGSHVADALSHSGYTARIFDRIRSPYLKSDQRWWLAISLTKRRSMRGRRK